MMEIQSVVMGVMLIVSLKLDLNVQEGFIIGKILAMTFVEMVEVLVIMHVMMEIILILMDVVQPAHLKRGINALVEIATLLTLALKYVEMELT